MMLLVAMPKTASTSVMVTLADLSGLPAEQVVLPTNRWPVGWFVLPHYHNDARELTEDDVVRFREIDRIYKQHVVPTDENLRLLADTPVVVLTRDPVEIVAAYRREAAMLGIGRAGRLGFGGLDSDSDWQERARDMGLVPELEAFRARWADHPSALSIGFRDLVDDPSLWVRSIQRHLGLPVTGGPVELSRMRWTGASRREYRSTAASPGIKAKAIDAVNGLLRPVRLEVRRVM